MKFGAFAGEIVGILAERDVKLAQNGQIKSSEIGSMEYIYLFIGYVVALIIAASAAAAAVIYVTSKRLLKAQESLQQQTDEYFKQVIEVVLNNQNKLSSLIVDEIRQREKR